MKYDFGLRPGDTQTEYVVLWKEFSNSTVEEWVNPANDIAHLKYAQLVSTNMFWVALLKRQVEYLSVEI